jgi:hypothetical protein
MLETASRSTFTEFFRQSGSDPRRAKFLSRLFGLFSEELVRIWSGDVRAPYSEIGRCTIYDPKLPKPSTLDFTFIERSSERAFVVEMKCEIEFQNFKFLTLNNPLQLEHHKKDSFKAFLSAAARDGDQTTKVKGRLQKTEGAILIWGAVSPDGRQSCMAQYGFHDVIGVDQIIEDLVLWNSSEFAAFIEQLNVWSNDLFSFLKPK